MIAGTIYVVFFGDEFLGQFTGFLITLGVPVAAWCGIMLADIASRRRDYAEADLFDRTGRYGDIRWLPVATVAVTTAIGWGLVTNASAQLADLAGLPARPARPRRQERRRGRSPTSAYCSRSSSSFLVQLIAGRRSVQAQEATA